MPIRLWMPRLGFLSLVRAPAAGEARPAGFRVRSFLESLKGESRFGSRPSAKQASGPRHEPGRENKRQEHQHPDPASEEIVVRQ
jgi:hypothetical protein